MSDITGACSCLWGSGPGSPAPRFLLLSLLRLHAAVCVVLVCFLEKG